MDLDIAVSQTSLLSEVKLLQYLWSVHFAKLTANEVALRINTSTF